MIRALTLALAMVAAAPVSAQTAPPPGSPRPAIGLPVAPPKVLGPVDPAQLQMRADSLLAVLAGGGDTTTMITPEVLLQLPDARIRALAKELSTGLGKPLRIESLTPVGRTGAAFKVRYERGTVDMKMAVESAPPYRLVGLLLTGSSSNEASLDEVVAVIEKLPGSAGFTLSRLGESAPQPIRASKPDTAFAIGSAFKLAILAELIRETAAGERHWDDLVTLDGTPLPGGAYMQQPKGTQVAIRALAQKMISVSDNSAADILLALVGRDKIEALLPALGWHDAARNRPFLSTLEAFKLKGVAGGALGERWRKLDEKGRRALLVKDVAATPISAIDPLLFRNGKPAMLDIEWFASPADLVRTIDWIRRHTETGPAAEARAILAVNAGVGPAQSGRWSYVGYKGGSEPGVIEMTFLLRDKAGGWWALAAAWNDPAAAVDETRFISLINRAIDLAAPTP